MDYLDYTVFEANQESLREICKDVYVVVSEFVASPGTVQYQDGQKNNDSYTIDIGWIIFDSERVEIIDDFEARFESDPDILTAIKANL